MVGYLGVKDLLDMVKYWFWYDWIMLGVRLLASVSIILATLNFQDGLTLPLWIIILLGNYCLLCSMGSLTIQL